MIFAMSKMSNTVARRNAKYQKMRMLGVKTYPNSRFDHFFLVS